MVNHLFVYMFGDATGIHSKPMLDPYSMRYEYTRYAPLAIGEKYVTLHFPLRYAPQSTFSAGSYAFTVNCMFSLFGHMIMHNYI